jgi:hypothetical protein
MGRDLLYSLLNNIYSLRFTVDGDRIKPDRRLIVLLYLVLKMQECELILVGLGR